VAGLLALQQQFMQGILSDDQTIILKICAQERLTPAEQLQIYKSSITGGLIKALSHSYPVCEKLVGADFFAALAREYLNLFPSQSFDLNQYGEHYALFIESFAPAAALPYLADVARLEWAWHKIYNAPSAPPFDFAKLAECYQQDSANIIFFLTPGSVLLVSEYPLAQIWEANQIPDTDDIIELLPDQTFYYLVWRDGHDRRCDELSLREWQLLAWIETGLSLHEICEQAALEGYSEQIDSQFPPLLQKGWIAGFKAI
jgi:hypothetical protein